MSLYKHIIRLFSTNTAYRMFLFQLGIMEKLPFYGAIKRLTNPASKGIMRQTLWGIDFKVPIGLGAGMDKEAKYYNSLSDYGMSFVMIGPFSGVDGVRKSIENIKNDKPRTVLAACIGKEHLPSFSLIYDFVDMFIIDVPDNCYKEVLCSILDERLTYEVQKPVLYRVNHEYSSGSLEEILDFCLSNGIDGFLVGSEAYVKRVSTFCSGHAPIIGYGKIRSAEAAESMLNSGASLIALTTGLVQDGPSLIRKILKHLNNNGKRVS